MNPPSERAETAPFPLRELPATVRLFLSGFLLTLSLGYGLGLLHVWEKTGMNVSGIQDRYGATETESHYAKSLGELLETTHNHTITFSFIFLAVGSLFSATAVPPRLKLTLLVEPWVAIPVTMGSMFGTRYLSPLFGYSMFAASILTACAFVAMVSLTLRELWLAPAGGGSR